MRTPTGAQFRDRAWEIADAAAGYAFGAETRVGQRGGQIDCSELVEQTGLELGVRPAIPDGSTAQENHARTSGRIISPADALLIPGALLWKPGHIGVSVGDGKRSIEARSKRSGVGLFDTSASSWREGLLMPGVTYTPGKQRLLKRGDVGVDVTDLAAQLNRWLDSLKLKGSGTFGPRTETLVRMFQAQAGITVDGEWGPESQAAMIRLLGKA